ncbi:MAG: chromosome segregation protein SMC [Opitutales bacterium]
MYLKQVTINGFKSFADKTEIDLPKGIIAIVGPNGCGKSNIVDAIRWVLGEQSAKALRGGKMQDVIFQGTDKRKPLPLCEVKLLFAECEKELGTNFNEVEIARRVAKDGGSNYYINGKVARLKEIQNLFMDTGIGRVSYSFMVQGQIDQILSSNPSERRAIFEEAAGITRYKTQRREALNKLALVDQNLARITDRIEEINRQIGSLKRQAAKALRYQKLSHRLKHLDIAINAKIYSEQSVLISQDEAQVNIILENLEKLNQELSQRQGELEATRSQRTILLENLEVLRSNSAEIRSQQEQAQRNCEFAQLRKRDILERGENIQAEIEKLETQLSNLRGKTQGDAKTKQEQLELVFSSDELFKQQNRDLILIEQRLSATEQELSKAKQDSLVNEGAITRLRSNCSSIEVDLKSYEVRHATASDTAYQLKEEILSYQARDEEFAQATETAKYRLSNVQEEISQIAQSNSELIQAYRAKQVEIQSLDRTIASKSAKLSLLNDLQEKLEGYSDGVRAVMQGKVEEVISPSSVNIIAQSLDIKEEWAYAFETMLSSSIDALSLDDESKISPLLDALRDRNLGKACIKIKDFLSFTQLDNLPANIYKCQNFISPTSDDATLALSAKKLLDGCYFCEDILEFLSFALAQSNFNFALAVDRNGNVLDCRGVIYSASQSKDTESSFILRNKEIKRLSSEIELDNNALTKLHEEAMSLQAQMDNLEEEAKQKKAIEAEIKRELLSIEAQLSNLEQNKKAKQAELSKQNMLLEDMENSRFEAQNRLKQANDALSQAEEKIENSRLEINKKEAQIEDIRFEKEQKQAELSELRLDLATKKQALDNLEKGLNATKQQEIETETQLQKIRIELEQSAQTIQNLEENSLKDLELSTQLKSKLDALLNSIEEEKLQLSRKEEALLLADKDMQELSQRHRKALADKNDLDIKLAKLNSKREFAIERILSDYELDISTIDYREQLWKADEKFELKLDLKDIEDEADSAPVAKDRPPMTEESLKALESSDFIAIEEELKTLRQKIASMGAVNLVAIDEYVELKERYDFLKAQSDDLWKAKNDLVSAIDEINETSKKLFIETFEQIRKNFEFTFQKLFGGGHADLNLVETEDVLDSGIEIIARPPGTVLKSLSLLSGGQRTMTAVALLFAIYMVKPSPFCVLDELDAPLDDANIGRYTDILKEFTSYSQFLIITHSKRTVSAANTIYGVTMQERGVTKLVSMRFSDYQ